MKLVHYSAAFLVMAGFVNAEKVNLAQKQAHELVQSKLIGEIKPMGEALLTGRALAQLEGRQWNGTQTETNTEGGDSAATQPVWTEVPSSQVPSKRSTIRPTETQSEYSNPTWESQSENEW